MNISPKELASLSKHNIQYISEVAVNWGSWSIGEATVRLMKLALADPTISYLHLVKTGSRKMLMSYINDLKMIQKSI